MKRNALIISVFLLISMTSCSTDKGNAPSSVAEESIVLNTAQCDPPAQEAIFLVTKEVFSEGPDITEASLITTDGRIIDASDIVYDKDHERIDNWYEDIPGLLNTGTVEKTVPQEDLYVMYNFINETDLTKSYTRAQYAENENDSGTRYLYYLHSNGQAIETIQLCSAGESNKYLRNDDIIDFCKWMDQHDYYGMG